MGFNSGFKGLTYITQLARTPRFQEVASYYDRLNCSLYVVPSVDECSGTGCLHTYEYLNAKYNSHPNIIHNTALPDTCSRVIWCTWDFGSLYQFAAKATYMKLVRPLLSITISKLHIIVQPSKIFCAKPDAKKRTENTNRADQIGQWTQNSGAQSRLHRTWWIWEHPINHVTHTRYIYFSPMNVCDVQNAIHCSSFSALIWKQPELSLCT